MKVNLKLRLKNKATLTAIVSTVLLLAFQLGIKLPENIQEIASTVLVLLTLLGVITDPTTEGIQDSEQALKYEEPKRR